MRPRPLLPAAGKSREWECDAIAASDSFCHWFDSQLPLGRQPRFHPRASCITHWQPEVTQAPPTLTHLPGSSTWLQLLAELPWASLHFFGRRGRVTGIPVRTTRWTMVHFGIHPLAA